MFHVIPKLQSGNERRPTVYLENRPSAREEGDSEDVGREGWVGCVVEEVAGGVSESVVLELGGFALCEFLFLYRLFFLVGASYEMNTDQLFPPEYDRFINTE